MINPGEFLKWLAVFRVPTGTPVGGYLPLSGGTMTGALFLAGAPSSPTQAADKQYVDSVAAGLAPYVGGVSAATTANIPGTYNNGIAGVGATYTVTATGATVLDGQTVTLNSYYLLKNLTNAQAQGIYQCTVAGTTGVQTVFTRASNYNTPSEITATGAIPVLNGTAQGGSVWYELNPITTIGTSAFLYQQFGLTAPVQISQGGTGATSQAGAQAALGIGTLGLQSATSVNIGGGTAIINDLTSWFQYAALSGDSVLAANDSMRAFVYTAPSIDLSDGLGLSSYTDGMTFTLKNLSGGSVTFTPFTGEYIDGMSQLTLANGDGYVIQKDATQWSIVGTNVGGGGGGVTSTQVQQAAFNYGLDTGIADAYIVDLSPVVASLTDGLTVIFTPLNNNATGSPTLQLNALSPVSVFTYQQTALNPGDFNTANPAICVYSAADSAFLLQNPVTTPSAIQVQQAAFNSASDTGTANTYSAYYSLALTALPSSGTILTITDLLNSNTGSSTFSPNGITPAFIVDLQGNLLIGGEMIADNTYNLQYSSGIGWVLLNPSNAALSYNIQKNSFISATDTGGAANTYAANIQPGIVTLTDGTSILLLDCANDNTGASTLAVESFNEAIVNLQGAALSGGEMLAGYNYLFIYNASYNWFVLQNSSLTGNVTGRQVQESAFNSAADSGTVNAYAANYSPAFIGNPPTGTILTITNLLNSNTGISTITVNGGATTSTIYDSQGNLLLGGELLAGNNYNLQFLSSGSCLLLNSSSAPLAYNIQNLAYTSANDGGSVNAYVANVNPPISSFTLGMIITVSEIANANTDASTLTVNSNSPIPIVNSLGQPLSGGEILDNNSYNFQYNSSGNFALLNSSLFAGVTNTQVQQNAFNTGNDSGVANAYIVTPSPVVASFTDGIIFTVTNILNSNTSSTTLQVNASSTYTVLNIQGDLLTGGELLAGGDYNFQWNANSGTFILLNPSTFNGYLQAPLGVKDPNGNIIQSWTYVSSAVNYLVTTNSPTLNSPAIEATGSDADVGINFIAKGNTFYWFYPGVNNSTRIVVFGDSATSGGNAVVLTAPTGLTASYTVTLPDHSGILATSQGTATNNNAPAGHIGEFISSVISSGSPVSCTNSTPTNVTSISLTAGDWDVWGNVTTVTPVTSMNDFSCWISATSATLPDASLYSLVDNTSALMLNAGLSAPYRRFSLASTTTVYLSCELGGASGTGSACGGIYARRASTQSA
jgi:hypothetical protein